MEMETAKTELAFGKLMKLESNIDES